MNTYTFNEIVIGQEESFQVEVTDQMQHNFTRITGDINPMHINQEYAKSCGYRDVLVYGMLTASFYSTLVGVYLPGKYCLFQECHTYFNKPVYCGDILTVSGKVIDKLDWGGKSSVIVKGTIKNQNGDTVSKAKLIAGCLK